MTAYAREHPLRSVIAIAAALTMLALGFYVATARAGSAAKASVDDHGGMILLRDDLTRDDRGASGANDDPSGHDAGDDRGGASGANDDPSSIQAPTPGAST